MSNKIAAKYLLVSGGFLLLYFGYSFLVQHIVDKFEIVVPATNVMASEWGVYIKTHIAQGLLILLFSAFFEELVFRQLPLTPFLINERWTKYWLIPAVVSSYIFGYVHGNVIHAYILGGAGFLFSLQVVTIWNLDETRNSPNAVIATALTHFVRNALVAYVLF